MTSHQTQPASKTASELNAPLQCICRDRNEYIDGIKNGEEGN